MSRNGTTSRKTPRTAIPAVAIVVSRYNATITDRLLDGARAAYQAAGGNPDRLLVIDAPGAFELPALALAAATRARILGVLALGCIIKGETRHDEYIAHAVAGGIVGVTLRTGIPVAFGVLTTENVQQAEDRAGGSQGNKGAESMEALLQTIAAADAITKPARRVSSSSTSAARPDKAKARRAR